LQPPYFSLQFSDSTLQSLDDRSDLLLRKSLVDMLWAVPIPKFDVEKNGALDLARIIRITKS